MKITFTVSPTETSEELFTRLSPQIQKMLGECSRSFHELQLQKPTRTIRQNNSLHLFLGWLADALNESDNLLTMIYFGKKFEVKWTPETCKDRIFRPISVALFEKESTAKLTTAELSKVAETIQENLSKKLKINLNFPNELDRQLGIKNYETT